MNLLTDEHLAALDEPTRIRHIADLCELLETLWSDKTRRTQVQRHLVAAIRMLEPARDPAITRLAQLAPVAAGLTLHRLTVISQAALHALRNESPLETLEATFEDRLEPCGPSTPLTVVLDSLRSAHNVGSIMRSCEALQVVRLVLCGYTATPENAKLERAAMGSDRYVRWEWRPRVTRVLEALKCEGMAVFALETAVGATNLYDTLVPRGSALVLGNERHGLAPEVLERCDGVLYIPMSGRKNSLNVANAFSVCAFELARRWRDS